VARSEYRISVIYTKCKQLIIEIGCGVLMLIEQADMLTTYSSYGEHGPLRILLQISR